jgi:hypothetical protein
MNPPQVAQEYAAEEGFDCCTHDDGSVEVMHPRGGARVYVDGQVESAPNPRLKEVLERKLAAARANAHLQQDPSERCTIKFAAYYRKMPDIHNEVTRLIAVLKVKRHQLSIHFLEWDTKYDDKPGNYPLPSGPEFLVLLLLTDGHLWTTIRAAWPQEKEEYYRSHVGEPVNIEILGGMA